MGSGLAIPHAQSCPWRITNSWSQRTLLSRLIFSLTLSTLTHHEISLHGFCLPRLSHKHIPQVYWTEGGGRRGSAVEATAVRVKLHIELTL